VTKKTRCCTGIIQDASDTEPSSYPENSWTARLADFELQLFLSFQNGKKQIAEAGRGTTQSGWR
jgi:hypothetical protein